MNVKRPGLALGIYFGIGLLLWTYGIRDGSLYLLDIIAGIVVYKMTAY